MSFQYLIIALLGLFLNLAVAQVQPFLVTGFLDSAEAKSGTAPNRGGTVKISGFTVTIPDNLLVEFPALFVPFAEFATGGPSARLPPNEVSITGNIVNNEIIAGQMSCAQLELAGSSGTIESISTSGAIKIRNGPTIRINDPNAKYSAGFKDLPFYTADDENPSITSFSGFPMCVPRGADDPKCPASNRPSGQSFTVPDAKSMVPIKVGDYVEYSGVQYNGETIVYGMVVNIGILTSGSQPGFVRVEDVLVGIGDTNVDVEAARYRFVGLASRSDLPISIYAIDEDPCTGVTSDRLLTSTRVEVSARNKWKVDIARGTNVGKYTRNYRIKIGDNIVETNDGIRAGQYINPVTEWIFPELVTPGGTPPPNDFSNIGPLRDGFGRIDDVVFGQLKPWPGASAPTPLVVDCPPPSTSNPTDPPPSTGGGGTGGGAGGGSGGGGADDVPAPPVLGAAAGADITVLSGLSLVLPARQTNPNVTASELRYNWTQIAGPTIPLTNALTANLTIAPPIIDSGSVSREFQCVITHAPTGAKANDTIVVTAGRATNLVDHPVILSLTWASKQSGTATAQATTDLVDSKATMKISFGGGAEQTMGRISTANGIATYSFSSSKINRYTTATVKSYIGTANVSGAGKTSTTVTAG